jgi:hypothetical protein
MSPSQLGALLARFFCAFRKAPRTEQASMAFQQVGITTFVLGEIARPFRFRISVANLTLQIWLQDAETQDEWYYVQQRATDVMGGFTHVCYCRQTGKLYVDEYAYDVVIPNATTQDYGEVRHTHRKP